MNVTLWGGDQLATWDIVDNTAEKSWATVQRPDGSYEIVALKPLARGASAFWTSPVTRKTDPTRWRIDISALGSRLDVVVTGPRGQVVPGWARRSHRSRERQVQEEESHRHHLRRNDRRLEAVPLTSVRAPARASRWPHQPSLQRAREAVRRRSRSFETTHEQQADMPLLPLAMGEGRRPDRLDRCAIDWAGPGLVAPPALPVGERIASHSPTSGDVSRRRVPSVLLL